MAVLLTSIQFAIHQLIQTKRNSCSGLFTIIFIFHIIQWSFNWFIISLCIICNRWDITFPYYLERVGSSGVIIATTAHHPLYKYWIFPYIDINEGTIYDGEKINIFTTIYINDVNTRKLINSLYNNNTKITVSVQDDDNLHSMPIWSLIRSSDFCQVSWCLVSLFSV